MGWLSPLTLSRMILSLTCNQDTQDNDKGALRGALFLCLSAAVLPALASASSVVVTNCGNVLAVNRTIEIAIEERQI